MARGPFIYWKKISEQHPIILSTIHYAVAINKLSFSIEDLLKEFIRRDHKLIENQLIGEATAMMEFNFYRRETLIMRELILNYIGDDCIIRKKKGTFSLFVECTGKQWVTCAVLCLVFGKVQAELGIDKKEFVTQIKYML
jgi:hypothetical protein